MNDVSRISANGSIIRTVEKPTPAVIDLDRPTDNLSRDTSEMRMHLRDRVAPGFSDTWREASLKHGLVLGSQYQDIE